VQQVIVAETVTRMNTLTVESVVMHTELAEASVLMFCYAAQR
jgi:hypothetical protein